MDAQADRVGGPSRSEAAWPPVWRSWLWVALLTAGYLCSYVDRQIINLLVDPIRADLGLSDTQFSLLTGFAFVSLFCIAGIPIGMLVDRQSRRVLVALGILAWSLATGLCGVADSFQQMFLARIAVGIGEATITPCAHSIMADSFPPEKLGRPMSVYLAGAGLGTGISLIFGSMLIDALNAHGPLPIPGLGPLQPWRTAFLGAAFLGLPIAIVALLMKDPPRRGLATAPQASWAEVFAFIRSNLAIVVTYITSVAFLAVVTFGVMAWSPAYLLRTLGSSPLAIGSWLGVVMMFGLPVGLLSGATIAEQLSRRGVRQASSIVYFGSFVLAIPCAIGLARSSTLFSALAWILCLLMTVNASTGTVTASFLAFLPGRLRGRVAAIYVFFQTGIGLTLGTLIPALLTDHVFGGDGRQVGNSLMLTIIAVAPLGIASIIVFRRAAMRTAPAG